MKGWEIEVFKFLLNFILLVITWTLGRGLLSYWEDKQRLKQASLELRKELHDAFGEFKSLVRVWKLRGRPKDPELCPDLMREAIDLEGRVESLLSNVASLKELRVQGIMTLGLFRQGFQSIRQAIAKSTTHADKVPEDYQQTEYQLFNQLMPWVSRSAISESSVPELSTAQQNYRQIMAVRGSDWDNAVEILGEEPDKSWDELISTVLKRREEKGTLLSEA